MPFTASHVAAVLPFVRTPLIPSALVVGSMVPDVPLYLRMLDYGNTHSVAGVLGIDAVIGALVLVSWHLLLAEPFFATAPRPLQLRLARPDPRSLVSVRHWPGRFALTYASLVVGGATHILWDAYTHPGAWGALQVEWLSARHGPMYGAMWAHHASSLLGAVAVALWLLRWWRRTPPRAPAGPAGTVTATQTLLSTAWLLPLMAGAAVAIGVAFMFLQRGAGLYTIAFFTVTNGVVTAVTVAVLLAVCWQLQRVLRV